MGIPSPVTSTQRSLNRQSSSSSASRPQEPNSEGLLDVAPSHNLALQVSTASPSSSLQESGSNSMLQSTSSSESFTKCVRCSPKCLQCQICFKTFKKTFNLQRHMKDMHKARYEIFHYTVSHAHFFNIGLSTITFTYFVPQYCFMRE